MSLQQLYLFLLLAQSGFCLMTQNHSERCSDHFIRCAGKSPEFKCIQCNRSYESRTGLNYHNASFHSNESTPEDIKVYSIDFFCIKL